MDINEKMKLQEWAQDIIDQKNSGLTQREWCEKTGLSHNTYRYRCKRVRKKMNELTEQAAEQSLITSLPEAPETNDIEFAKICVSSPENTFDGISISLRGADICISSNAKDEHVKLVLEVFSHA